MDLGADYERIFKTPAPQAELILCCGSGYYMGPGLRYYGGGGRHQSVLALIIIYLIFGRGRERL
jgi:hypothetical protein